MDFGQIAWLITGIVILALTYIVLLWIRSTQNAFSGPEAIVLKRSPWRSPVRFLICASLAGISALVLAFFPLSNDLSRSAIGDTAVTVGALSLFFGLMTGAQESLFWAVDSQGVTRQALGFKKTLPWQSIDWVYPTRKTMTTRVNFIKTMTVTEEGIRVEAGPKQRINIVLRASSRSFGMTLKSKPSNADALRSAIQQRATNAIFGFDQYPEVRERRAQAQMGYPQR
jgi:hypothetical protein